MSAMVTTDPLQAARVLREGGLVAFPTETVYGLGAAALDVRAVARVFEAKRRPYFDPLIVHIPAPDRVADVVRSFPNMAERLARRVWPGPLTIVVPKSASVPDLVTSGLDTVGVRVPDHPLALAMLEAAGVPVAAPSANLFGRTSPTTASHVVDQLGDRIDLVLDGGPCRVGLESTVVLASEPVPIVLRLGGVSLEELEAAVGAVEVAGAGSDGDKAQTAPGQLLQHYAPHCRLVLVDDPQSIAAAADTGLLAFSAAPQHGRYGAVEILSPTGDLRESAANLFSAMRRLDAAGLRLIVAERVPDRDLGRAINDRLLRAAAAAPSENVES
jgi:L-threonylcarbamoyladenylate synthase